MIVAACRVTGCGRVAYCRELCRGHYTRRRRGLIVDVPLREKLPLGSNDACSVPSCSARVRSRQLCSTHYSRWHKHGDPAKVEKVGRKPGHAPEASGRWAGEDVGYHGAHKRIYKIKGPASSHRCETCSAPARDWAYDRTDPNERSSELGPYSLDPDRYHSLCTRCHKIHDVEQLVAGGWTVWNKGPEVCNMSDCERKAHARGLCSTHYSRWRKRGKKS